MQVVTGASEALLVLMIHLERPDMVAEAIHRLVSELRYKH